MITSYFDASASMLIKPSVFQKGMQQDRQTTWKLGVHFVMATCHHDDNDDLTGLINSEMP